MRRLLSFAAAAAAALAVPAGAAADVPGYRTAVMADGPLAYWHLDETSGSAAADFAGAGYNGTFAGGFALAQPAPFGDAANGAVRLGADGTMTPGVPGTTRTMELWVRPTLRTQQTLVRFGDPAAGGWALTLNGRDASRSAKRKLVFTSHGETTNPKVTLPANAWSHVTVSWASGGTLKFNVNGSALQKVTHPSQLPDQTADLGTLVVGPGAGAGGTSFDEIALYPGSIDTQAHYGATNLPVLLSAPGLAPLSDVRVGDTLTLTPGTWEAGTTVTDTWQRCDSVGACVPIAGASGTSYTLTPDDAGFTVQVQEDGANTSGSATVFTDATDPVANADGSQPTPPVLPPGSDPSVPPTEGEPDTSTPTPTGEQQPTTSNTATGETPTVASPISACIASVQPVRARRLRLRGAGRVTLRFDPRTRQASVRARRRTLKSVRWTMDRRRIGRRRSARGVRVPASRLTPGAHALRARITPRHGRARTVTLRILVRCA